MDVTRRAPREACCAGSTSPPMRYSIAQHSRPGSRAANEDRVAYVERDNAVIMVLADGLGGYAGGELAAETLAESIVHSFEKARGPLIVDPAAFLVLSINWAHSMITRRAESAGIDVGDLRTTCVVGLVQRGYAYWAHVGDSRLYHIRGGKVLTRTFDHSTSEQLYQEGVIDERDSRLGQGQLLRCVGGPRRPVVTLGPETRLDTGDALLLCSDGIWRAFKPRKLAELASARRPEDAVDEMLAQAEQIHRRDCDNISAILFRWEDAPPTERPTPAQSAPETDQDLFTNHGIRRTAAQPDLPPSRGRSRRDEIEETIEELESFVDGLEQLL